jgi:apolipoprotein N-acyltransferase
LKAEGERQIPQDRNEKTGLSPWSFAAALPAFLSSAAMLTVIQAPMGWSALAWVSFVPLILASSPEANPRRLFVISYLVCFFYWLANLYWLVPVTIAGWIVYCLYTALLWPVLTLCLRYCRARRIPLFLAAAVLIVGVERMQGLFLGGFFWRFLAHSQYQNIVLIQIADIFGAGGVSFLIALVNGLLAQLVLYVQERRNQISSIKNQNCGVAAMRQRLPQFCTLIFAFCFCLICVTATVLYGKWRIGQEGECVEAGPVVATLQSNVPQSVKRSFESGQELFDGLMEHSKAAVEAGAELIVWPETMVQAYLDTQVWRFLVSPQEDQGFDKALREHADGKAYVLVGAYGAELQQHGADRYLARYNSAFLYRPDGGQDEKRYDKIHLVPFGEVLPLRRSFAWFYEFLMKIKFIPYNFDYSLDYGSRYTVFDMTLSGLPRADGRKDEGREASDDSSIVHPPSSIAQFGVMICYEDTVPAIAREFALDKQGAKRLDWLVNISNDGWFVRFKDKQVLPSAELPQHAAVCVFRAVENRLAVVRSVNTGISCVIDSLGRIRDGYLQGTLPREAMARTGMPGWFSDRVPIDRRTTFFSKYGQWLDFSCELCVILLIIGPLSVRFVRGRKRKKAFGKVVK